MRINKDEAIAFLDEKIAQFQDLETAVDTGTFSLERYRAVYKETKIIVSRLFSKEEWEKFDVKTGHKPGMSYTLREIDKVAFDYEEMDKQNQDTWRSWGRPVPDDQLLIELLLISGRFWTALVAGLFKDTVRSVHLKMLSKKDAEIAKERRKIKKHLQACVDMLESYRKYLPLTRQTAFEFSVEELVSIQTGGVYAEQNSAIAFGKGTNAYSGVSPTDDMKEKTMGKKDKEHSVDITTGDVSADKGSGIAIGVENTAIVSTLAASGQTELAQALKTLADAVLASRDLPTDQKEEQVKVINQVGKEAAEPKPNKALLKFMVDGLFTTLKAVPDIAGAVKEAMPILGQLLPL